MLGRIRIRLLRSRWLPAAAIVLTLLTLAASVAYGTLRLRAHIRAEILSRDAELLHGLAQMVQVTQESDKQLGSRLEDLADQFAVALQISQLNQFNGVVATRLFDTNGQFTLSLPAHVSEITLTAADLTALRGLRPVSRFEAAARPADLFLSGASSLPQEQEAPLQEVLIPLHRQSERTVLGVVQFILDGRGVAGQFASLDRSLAVQGGVVFAAGAALIGAALSWAFRRLQRANRLLLERTSRLLRANEELALTAKTSAVGAITAHLVHGLSNPLAGLEDIVANRGRDELGDEEWRDAATSARRVKEMIADVLRILGEEQGVDRYEISLVELARLAETRIAPAAKAAGVALEATVRAAGNLSNREANLILLILDNLLRNAVQATPAGRTVQLAIADGPDGVGFEVSDQGPGVAAEARPRLFQPQRSRKRGGHGVGLAICKQLASHLEATLELAATSPAGSVFALRLPRHRCAGAPALDSGRQAG